MKVKISILSMCLLLGIAVLIGCGKLSIPTGDGGSISISKDGGLTVKGKDGEGSISVSGDQKIPKDFPKEIPIPKGAKVEGSFQTKSNGLQSFTITLTAKQELDEIMDLYDKFMEKEGYEDISGWGDSSFWSITGYKNDFLLSAMITVIENEGTSILLSYAPR